jgi:hypothetical protein
MTELKQIIGKLPKLTKAERQNLRQALDFFDGGRTKAATSTVPQVVVQDWLTPGIITELRRRGLEYSGLSEKRINGMAPDYITESRGVMIDLRNKMLKSKAQASTARLDHAELLGFGRIIAQVLADYLQNVRSINLKYMLTNISKVPDALEASFPGYLSSGFIYFLIKSHRGKWDRERAYK